MKFVVAWTRNQFICSGKNVVIGFICSPIVVKTSVELELEKLELESWRPQTTHHSLPHREVQESGCVYKVTWCCLILHVLSDCFHSSKTSLICTWNNNGISMEENIEHKKTSFLALLFNQPKLCKTAEGKSGCRHMGMSVEHSYFNILKLKIWSKHRFKATGLLWSGGHEYQKIKDKTVAEIKPSIPSCLAWILKRMSG